MIMLVVLELCSGQKCDGRTDGRTPDGQSGNYMLSLQGA